MSHSLQPLRTGLLLSGGIDSVVLLAQLLERGWQVVPFYVRTGCAWQCEELHAIRQLISRFARPRLLDLVQFELPLADIYGNHWSLSGKNVPNDYSPDEAVYLPGRNPLLLIKPAVWCRMNNVEHLAIATLAGNPFSDATPSFFANFEAMMHEAMAGRVEIACPLEHATKSRVMELGRNLPLELTFSCLSPKNGMHCGQCNKCAERHRGFRETGLVDRTNYATAPTFSATAMEHVK